MSRPHLRPRDRLVQFRLFGLVDSSIHSGTKFEQRVDYFLSVCRVRGPHLGPAERLARFEHYESARNNEDVPR